MAKIPIDDPTDATDVAPEEEPEAQAEPAEPAEPHKAYPDALEPEAVGGRKISGAFSHSKKRKERVMVTEEGKVYVRIKE